FQKYATESGAYIREHFFGPDPRLRRLVEHLSDEELQALPRGGHDYRKLYAAYKLATEQVGAPTAILAKTIKGWTLGPEIEARNATHQIKKMTKAQLLVLRDRLYLQDEIPESALDDELPPYYRPPEGSLAHDYLSARSHMLAGPVPQRLVRSHTAPAIDPNVFADLLSGSGGQAVSTTMAFARLLRNLVRDPGVGPLVAPIIPDEARTFGLEPLIAETKIYAPGGQRYTPVDSDLILRYAEDRQGQMLQEGISEAGAMSSFIALSTAYATWGRPMVPIYLFYSMFGFQRVGDLTWLTGDIRGRGILAGCTSGRTTLQGEGLQHDDGHSPLLASVNPAVRIYDPAFAYEIAVIMEEAVKKIVGPEPEDRFWYLTLYNENYEMPPFPTGDTGDEWTDERVRDGILKGAYRFAPPATLDDNERSAELAAAERRATLLFSGSMWRQAMEARRLLAEDWGVSADVWSVTSYTELRDDALSVERWNMLHPNEPQRKPYVSEILADGEGPVIAVSDYVRSLPDLVSRWVQRPWISLGTDGFGRSDTRVALRSFFEVDSPHLVVATLSALAGAGDAKADEVTEAIDKYSIETDSADPWKS
ncbi:MAG TPA: pyruvate dehydrogenase (acetyl-transferring), homodimeric type, partial [Acidimicrobiales bacterium]|nr:pyruvate dehydrogenase (acetyl-transferring), homodimeric type [Acidimicrobiales bacterium]